MNNEIQEAVRRLGTSKDAHRDADRQAIIVFIRTNATSKAFVPNTMAMIHAPGMLEAWEDATLIFMFATIVEREP